MTNIERISSFQLFCLIILFEIGTAAMVPLGVNAKQDAWLAVLLGMIGGLLIFLIYMYLHKQCPGQLLTSCIKQIFGTYIGFAVALLYILFFIYGAARDLRDGMELLRPTYNETPIAVTGSMIMLLVCYSLYKGLEVLARAGELYFGFFLIVGLLAAICLICSDVIDITKTLPVLEKGWKPIATAAYEQTIMFPFGELICFTMVIPYLLHPKESFKTGLSAIILSGIVLAILVYLEISVLGTTKLTTVTFPFLRLMQYINISDVIQRLDAFVLISLIIHDFFKVAIFSFAALIGIADIFPIAKKKLVLPIGIATLATSILIAPNTQEHFEQGLFALKYIFPVFALYVPLVLLLVSLLRTFFTQKSVRENADR